MKETKKNQSRPIRLTLEQAQRVVWMVDDLIMDRRIAWSEGEKAIMEPLIGQIQLVQAQIQGELVGETPARDIPIRGKPGDKAR